MSDRTTGRPPAAEPPTYWPRVPANSGYVKQWPAEPATDAPESGGRTAACHAASALARSHDDGGGAGPPTSAAPIARLGVPGITARAAGNGSGAEVARSPG